jgi:hypothetical protein
MPFYAHERFQMHCQFCAKQHEADTAAEALAKVEAHEAECPKKDAPATRKAVLSR